MCQSCQKKLAILLFTDTRMTETRSSKHRHSLLIDHHSAYVFTVQERSQYLHLSENNNAEL